MMDRPRIPEALVAFIESGVSISVGTRDVDLVPDCVRAAGAWVHPDRSVVTVLVPTPGAEITLENLRTTRLAAVVFSQICDHRTIQLKGPARVVRPATPEEHARAEAYRAAFARALEFSGVPTALTLRFNVSRLEAVEIEPTDLFHQTPGPRAGVRLEGGS